MTVSGQRTRAENVAASSPVLGQSAAITATTPLPKGWGSFCSTPDATNPARWYATAPWHADTIRATVSDAGRSIARKLAQTVDADTWSALHKAVEAQVALHASLMEVEGE